METDAYATYIQDESFHYIDIGMDIFRRGLCLPSDIKMTDDEQARVIEVIRSCFG